jgi:hypothetical protein
MPSARGTADLKQFVRTEDGHDYAVKSTDEHPSLPASEFICYRLAASCSLPVPYSQVIELREDTYAFGSRIEGGVTEWAAMGPSKAREAFNAASEIVSAILAFDLFVGNVDRHTGNFLFRKNSSGQWVPLAIDYSRALLIRGFPNDTFPMATNENTQITIAQMKLANFWSGPFAIKTVELLRSIGVEHLRHWMIEMPNAWLTDESRRLLIEWWQSDSFKSRLDKMYGLL